MTMTAWQRASDAELISAVRGNDLAAWAELCHRHLDAARRLARTLVPAKAADDLVARAGERVLADLRRGEGPDVAFRPYLLTAVCSEQGPSSVPVQGVQPPSVRAFRALPERWQLMLWHVEVERDRPDQVAPLIGVAARSVPAIARRAGAGLGAATLALHAREAADPHQDCAWTREHLPAYIRGVSTRRESGKVSAHVQGCTPCRSVHAELAAVHDDLAGVLGPLVLGTAAAGYLTTTTRKAGVVARHPGGAALAGVAAAVVLITGVALGLNDPEGDPPAAEAPVQASPSEGQQSTGSGVTLEPSASGEPDDQTAPTPPGSQTAAPSPVPPTATPFSPPPPAGSSSDDPTTDSPDSDITVPPTSAPPPTTPQPARADPAVTAVTADPPTSAGSVSQIQVVVEDVAETDMRLTIEVKGSDVELSPDPSCTPMEGAGYWICDLTEDASTLKFTVDRRGADGETVVTFGITPRAGVVENSGNNQDHVVLPPPPSED
jgi:hypothetical protein